jgi:hypothetical protein
METESEENQKSDKTVSARKPDVAQVTKVASDKDFSSELNAPHWSVVSFETCLARGLTYDKAVKKMKRLAAKKIAGLCIVTDEVANRITNQNTL